MAEGKTMKKTVGTMKLSYIWWMYVLYSWLQIHGTETLFINFTNDIFQNTGIPNNEERYTLNQLHIISLMECYSEGIMMEFFSGAQTKKM